MQADTNSFLGVLGPNEVYHVVKIISCETAIIALEIDSLLEMMKWTPV